MSWEIFFNGSAALKPDDWLEWSVRAVREVVQKHRDRNLGVKGIGIEEAFIQASLDLGITERRTRSLYYRELRAIPRQEYLNIADKFLAHLDAEAKVLEQRSREVRRRRDQFRLELGGKWPDSCISMLGEYGRSFATLAPDGSSSFISQSAARKRR